jgi:hypothetical protein
MIKRWWNNWNPWALRREIALLEHDLWHTDERLLLASKENIANNERFAFAIKENIANKKRIETLESELHLKESECNLHSECAQFNLKEKEKALNNMRIEIHAAIGLLHEVAKEGTEAI